MSDITKHPLPFLLAALTTGLLACGPTPVDGGGFGETGSETETGETGEGPEVEPPYGPEPGDGDSGDGDPGVGVAPVPGDGDGDGDPGDGDPGDGSIDCGIGVCDPGYGCTIADTCVDCAFVVGVYGCGCNISGECESTSVCVDGVCSAY